MHFLNPAALYYLIGLGLFFLLHQLRQEKKEKVVPALFLWEDLPQNDEASPLHRRFKPDELFFLQLLILILLLLALLQPVLLVSRRQPGPLVLVIDCSASMLSTDLSPNRFQQAVAAGLNLLQENRARKTALVAARAVPEVLTTFTDDQQLLRRLLRDLTPKPEGADPQQALALASTLLGPSRGEIVFITDGAFPALDYQGTAPLQIIQVGQPVANLAINGLEARATGRPGEYQVLVKLNNFSPQVQTTQLQITAPEASLPPTALTFQPWEEKALFYNLTADQQTTWQFFLEGSDALTLDNQAALTVGREPGSVLLVGPGNFFLEQGLRALPQTTLTYQPQITPAEAAPYDLIIFDRTVPPPGIKGRSVLINTSYPEWERPVRIGWSSAPEQIWGETSHPLLRFVEPSNWRISSQLLLKLEERAVRPLASSPTGPVLLSVEEPGRQTVLFCFDLFASNLPLQASFPVLLSNLLLWAKPEPLESGRTNLLPAVESDLTPRSFTTPPLDRRPETATMPESRDLWPLFVLAALFFLTGEWFCYHRPSPKRAKEGAKRSQYSTSPSRSIYYS
ncbi:MAG: VWA domain-containing protein, partial [Firmicutes bacterium]|nr:VWA domain-containing protein [Bacillota bacterium]